MEIKAATLDEYVAELVRQRPALGDEQLERLRQLLPPTEPGEAATDTAPVDAAGAARRTTRRRSPRP